MTMCVTVTCGDDDDTDDDAISPVCSQTLSFQSTGRLNIMESPHQATVESSRLSESSTRPTATRQSNSTKQSKQRTVIDPPDTSTLASVIRHCLSILFFASEHKLRAVELANAARSRVGVEALASIREYMGGLLNVLEAYPNLFVVYRIPKNDVIMLTLYAFNQMSLHGEEFFSLTNAGLTSGSTSNVASMTIPHQFEFDSVVASSSSTSSATSAVPSATASASGSLWNSPAQSPHHHASTTCMQSSSKLSSSSSISLPATPTYKSSSVNLSPVLCALLSRLVDDSYVPTMAWKKADIDNTLINLICSFIHHFRSSTSFGSSSCHITRLRKAIRQHFQLTENIKTVALKAFLSAYSSLFSLSVQHHVSLTYEGMMLGVQISSQVQLPVIDLATTSHSASSSSKEVEVPLYPPIELGRGQTSRNMTCLHIFGDNPLFPELQKTTIV